MSNETRSILVQDDDCHWYVIPANKRYDWRAFLDSGDSEDDDVPDYATRVGGHPSLVTFTDWRIE